MSAQVAVVGAGLSGLTCALTLQNSGVDVVVVEAAPQVGGRVRTEKQDGYTFDVGFQVLLTGYPAAREWLDFEALDLRCFPAGALIHKNKTWCTYADPLRQPSLLWSTLTSPVGSLLDKMRLVWLRARLWSGHIPVSVGESTHDFLIRWGFSQGMIREFFRPFFGGVFLESSLRTSAHKFLQLFHLFSVSSAVVPASGMGAIPLQLAQGLRHAPLLLTRVEALEGTRLHTTTEQICADCVVLAGPGPETLHSGETVFHSAQTFYFSCPEEVSMTSMLMLDPGSGPINNIAPLSRIAPYAPVGRSLVAVSVLEQGHGVEDILAALARLIPADWTFLREYKVEHALPVESRSLIAQARLSENVYRCGDHCSSGSIQGALESGRATALAILKDRDWRRSA